MTAAELVRMGAANTRVTSGGVHFEGDLALLYRANLCLRTATRVLCPLRDFAAITPEMLYSQVRRIPWEKYLNPHKTLAVHATVQAAKTAPSVKSSKKPKGKTKGAKKAPPKRGASWIANTMFPALKIKDAIVDRLRQEQGARPNVDKENPDILVHAHFAKGRCTLSLDSTGTSLHERGYRVQGSAAPLKETLAAAIIELTGWDGNTPLIDPMCGSGTLVIEAALKALHVAPGLLRKTYAFQRWADFDRALWHETEESARSEILPIPSTLLRASDIDPKAVQAAQANARRAGVGHAIRFTVQRFEDVAPTGSTRGVFVVNPPYGERMGEEEELEALYERLGEVWQERFGGWTAFVFAGNLSLARHIGLNATQKHKLNNGPLECRLLKFPIPIES